LPAKPNLNGIWQALNTANYNVLSHPAKAALQMRPGPVVPFPPRRSSRSAPVGSVPAGNGIVEGDEIPYLPEAAKKQKENEANWLDRDPGDQVLPARHSARQLHGDAVPDPAQRQGRCSSPYEVRRAPCATSI
jgi:hypothetical protein